MIVAFSSVASRDELRSRIAGSSEACKRDSLSLEFSSLDETRKSSLASIFVLSLSKQQIEVISSRLVEEVRSDLVQVWLN